MTYLTKELMLERWYEYLRIKHEKEVRHVRGARHRKRAVEIVGGLLGIVAVCWVWWLAINGIAVAIGG